MTITFDNGTMTDWVVVVNDACGGTEVPGSCTIGPIAPFDVTVAPNTDHWVRVYSNTQFGTGGTFSICISAAVITGQTEVPASSAWSVFPNPSSGSLNVVWKEASSDVWIELFDLSGRAVFTDRAMLSTGATHALSFTNPLAQGTYSLRLTGPNGASEQRVVVN